MPGPGGYWLAPPGWRAIGRLGDLRRPVGVGEALAEVDRRRSRRASADISAKIVVPRPSRRRARGGVRTDPLSQRTDPSEDGPRVVGCPRLLITLLGGELRSVCAWSRSRSPSTGNAARTRSNRGCCWSTTCAEQLGKVGTPVGCDTSNCGACTVLLDGQTREVLQRARGAGRRRRGHDHRGPRGRRVAPVQKAFKECHGAAVRLLHPRHGHGRRRPAQGEPEPERGRDPRRARGQPLPLHRLPEHRQGRAARRRCGRCPSDRLTEAAPAVAAEARSVRALRRKEDARLLTGRTNWTDNITLPGTAAHGDPAQPDGARPHHPGRRLAGAAAPRRRRGVLRPPSSATSWATMPCAWPVTEDIKIPDSPAAGHGRGALRRRVRRRRGRPRPLRRGRRARGHRGRLRAAARRCSTWRPRWPTAPTGARPTLGTNTCVHLEAQRRRLRGRRRRRPTGCSRAATSTSG